MQLEEVTQEFRRALGARAVPDDNHDLIVATLGDLFANGVLELPTPLAAMGRDCWAHTHDGDVPLAWHHVWPLGNGGPDIAANKLRICYNAHAATHDLLSKLLKNPQLSWTIRRRYGYRVRRIATAGYTAITTRGVIIP